MDYIREELLRQQALLVILLTGQRTEPLAEAEERRGSGEAAGWEAAAERMLSRERTGGRRAEPPLEGTLPATAALRAVLETSSAGGRIGAAAEKDAAVRRNSAAAAREMTGRAAGGTPPETGEIRLVTEVRRPESGRSPDPAALSRAFQRDARRYDGGFRLY